MIQQKKSLAEEPSTFVHKLANELDVNRNSAAKIMRKCIEFLSYKIQTSQFFRDATNNIRDGTLPMILHLIDTGQLNQRKGGSLMKSVSGYLVS